MQVTFIPSEEVNSDLGVVNAARVSLNKKSSYHSTGVLKLEDKRLINYLVKHNHWTPFAHARLYFEFDLTLFNPLYFLLNYNPGGFSLYKVEGESKLLIKGSLYSWINNMVFLSEHRRDYILNYIEQLYPVCCSALKFNIDHSFSFAHGMLYLSEDYIEAHELWKLATATLLVKVPIFIARQIRTSQVGIAYSDLYVEGESFVFNEVSRRYVNDDPEFYKVEEWRVREGGSIKQGSTGVLNETQNNERKIVQNIEQSRALATYKYDTQANIAPEQSRADLPQSMYTEFYMTATLHRWAQFLQLRLKPDVQLETRQVASLIASALSEQYPAWATEYGILEMASGAI